MSVMLADASCDDLVEAEHNEEFLCVPRIWYHCFNSKAKDNRDSMCGTASYRLAIGALDAEIAFQFSTFHIRRIAEICSTAGCSVCPVQPDGILRYLVCCSMMTLYHSCS